MQKRYSDTVRIFYPRFDRKEIEERIRDGLDELKERLSLLLVVLFGSYAKGNYTVASIQKAELFDMPKIFDF
jgi:hypothetical protein